MKKTIVGITIAALALGSFPAFAGAQTSSDTLVSLQTKIAGLFEQIQGLRSQMNDLRKQASEMKQASSEVKKDIKKEEKEEKKEGKEEQKHLRIARSLFRGMSGDDVRQIQEILAKYPDLYPEGLVTGYFGPATENAVKRFQEKHGIEQIGIVGPKTLKQIAKIFNQTENKLERLGADTSGLIPAFQTAASTTLQATTTANGSMFVLCHNAKRKHPHTITIAPSAVFAHLAHGDTIGACATTTPNPSDNQAPILFGISANPQTTSASVSWMTNESSDSTVWYATSTPVMEVSSKAKVENTTLVTSHSLNLSGLTANTTYYFLVVSKDASGNSATSTTGAFTTTTVSTDTAAPVIFGVSAIPSVGNASVLWLTNESATSRVWYAKISDVMNDTERAMVSDNTLTTSHNANLTGLTQGTLYYFLLVSTDASGNTATSTSNLYVFTTANLSLSGISTSGITGTSANVNWQTNTASDSTVWYATSTPVLSASDRASASSNSSVTSHSLSLTGLATSMTYYYLVVSRDAFGNSATSSENAFTTLSN